MKPYHLLIFFIIVVVLIAPNVIAGIGLAAGVVGVFLWLLAAALGFPGWRSRNRP
jgi:hypothetical protein